MSIFIVAAKRTPFGSFGGSLKALTSTDLCVESTKGEFGTANARQVVTPVMTPNFPSTSPLSA